VNSITRVDFYEVARPLRTLFSTSLGKKDRIHNVIVKVVLRDGSSGAGEVPTSFSVRQETVPVIAQTLREFRRQFRGLDIDDYASKLQEFRVKFPAYPMTLSGIEVALFRARLKSLHKSEYDFWGATLKALETDITIPFVLEENILKKWMEYVLGKGFRSYKVKVSGDIEKDKKFLSIVRRFLDSRIDAFTLRIDGNQGYSAPAYLKITDMLKKERYPVECFEQPLRKDDYAGFKEITPRSPFPVILDETVFTCDEVRRVIDENLGHGINIKLAKSGISQSRQMISLARKNSLKLMIGCMTETMAGLSAGILCACGTGAFDFVDLDSIHFLFRNRPDEKIIVEGPKFIVRPRKND
jgi:L-alanine-DL-glutamate epimerase-like enolase superfamily enzyme